ncbi:MAG: undecaprenyldiphospho-muramoylpentapeptide beta-N-acetylglucosaminyltransferase [Candidatus Marinimicrobia bacterium]|nr:undecaprenyldiphospho-muramoylpentapeptide beta-N-acetylglucosaminyltransferase [Candidatus Neomarinimicrobiota bacterium]
MNSKRKQSFYMNSKTTYTIMITGGGTGGHYYPAIAIADAIREQAKQLSENIDIQCHYIGSKLGIEQRLAPKYDYPYTLVPIKGFSRYISLASFLQNLILPFRLLISWFKIKRLYHQLDPIATVATGGYVSLIPGLVSHRNHVPLFLQEQNAFPGVTSRMLAKRAMGLFYSYDSVKDHIKDDVLFIKSSNPVRSSIKRIDKVKARMLMELDPDKFTLFIFGGSQGAMNVNKYIAKRVQSWIHKYDIQILWQTGDASYDMLCRQFCEHKSIHLKPYIENMSAAYSAADMVISRAGALTLAEIEKMRKPSILIPLPTAAGNHQYHNAKALESLGCAVIVEESEFPDKPLVKHLNNMINSPDKLINMANAFPKLKEDAAEQIARDILSQLQIFYTWSQDES